MQSSFNSSSSSSSSSSNSRHNKQWTCTASHRHERMLCSLAAGSWGFPPANLCPDLESSTLTGLLNTAREILLYNMQPNNLTHHVFFILNNYDSWHTHLQNVLHHQFKLQNEPSVLLSTVSSVDCELSVWTAQHVFTYLLVQYFINAIISVFIHSINVSLQCSGAVGWMTGRASGL